MLYFRIHYMSGERIRILGYRQITLQEGGIPVRNIKTNIILFLIFIAGMFLFTCSNSDTADSAPSVSGRICCTNWHPARTEALPAGAIRLTSPCHIQHGSDVSRISWNTSVCTVLSGLNCNHAPHIRRLFLSCITVILYFLILLHIIHHTDGKKRLFLYVTFS